MRDEIAVASVTSVYETVALLAKYYWGSGLAHILLSMYDVGVLNPRITLLIPSAPMTISAAYVVPSEKWRTLCSVLVLAASIRMQRLLKWAMPAGRYLTRASR